ncbi:MAG: prenyltransferase/squalene oxidase repeat-containing protein [Solirubrobacteraceae bacterium]
MQLHVRSPIDIRIWRRSPRPRLAKTLALFAKAALLNEETMRSDDLRLAGRHAANELYADRAAGSDAWGYPFPVQTRWSYYAANTPNVVVTSFAIDALLLAAQRLDEPRFEQRAHRAGEWLAERLLTTHGHFAYHEHSDALIHNANLLGAAAVHRTLGDAQLVKRAVELTLEAQRPDASFPYGDGANLQFVDNFHTAYVLSSLTSLRDVDPTIDVAVRRGARYWTGRFFDEQGRALLWPNRRFPEDGHSAGSALSTLALLAERDAESRALLRVVAERALDAMVVRGRAVHRRHRWGRTRLRYLRWCDSHVALGMATGALSLAG